MTDYSELVKKLRDLHRDPRPASAVWLFDNQIALYDAADAIEELEYEIRESMQKCAECGANEPKRGEWEEIVGEDGCVELYQCSECNAIYGREWNYCPNCGAKMEVQE